MPRARVAQGVTVRVVDGEPVWDPDPETGQQYIRPWSPAQRRAALAQGGRTGGRRSGAARRAAAESKAAEARVLAEQGLDRSAIAQRLGVSRRTVGRWLPSSRPEVSLAESRRETARQMLQLEFTPQEIAALMHVDARTVRRYLKDS